MVVNTFGEHDPDGMMYVLKENEPKVRELVARNPFMPVELVQPLTIRANAGDEIEILFENQLPFPTSMHIQRAEYDVQASDGAFAGFNADSATPAAPPGGTRIYRWSVFEEGVHIFTDLGNPLSSELGSNVHGLFGALIVEPKGSRWTDPVTGEPLESGVFADVHHPLLPSFREFTWFFHDEMEIHDLTGGMPIDPHTFQPMMTPAVNYRSEPHRNRVRLIMEGVVDPNLEGEEVHHDSWVFGDPSTPVMRAYVGDPIKMRLVHGGIKETHVQHWHVHQWLFDQNDPDSELTDSQAISPQNSYTISLLYGSGSLQGAFGEAIVHCHLYPHFMEGMWGIHRTFNTLQGGTQCYPNGVPISALRPLPDREPPPRPTLEKPGFPGFVPGVFTRKAPRPPLGIAGGRHPTELEENQFAPNASPGAPFVNPCIEGKHPVREYHIVAIQRTVVYNRAGWHDPEGRLFVLAEDEEDVRCGRKPPHPLVIRANAGDCLKITFTNKLPEVLGGNAFQLATRTYETGIHIHFFKFDPLASDAANIGWNYDTNILPGQTIRYQWFADAELRGVFIHDHQFATTHQQHGLFGGVNIQPRGSEWFDSRTGEEIRTGEMATIAHPLIPSFRELTLFPHDFALLFDACGCPLNQPLFPGSLDDPGVMGVNYRSEPLQFRLGSACDPAYVFSSFVNGDPVTPLMETYNGDPVRVRLFNGAQEESHSFNLHRQRWHQERRDLDSDLVQQQHIGISEHFTLEFAMEGEGDYDLLYHFGSLDDVWVGNWGLIRSFEERVDDLIPLPDRPRPPYRLQPLPEPTGERPPLATDPGFPGPLDAPVRRYEVVALQTTIVYNAAGDHDPFGIVFALAGDAPAIEAGSLNPEPLILRGNAGQVIEVTLHNRLDPDKFHREPAGIHGFPGVPVDAPFPPSLRMSLHAQLLEYDVRGSDGGAAGFNPDTTIGPGESITYRWHVDSPLGSCNLWDMADLRNHRHHGSFGIFIAEPKGTEWLDPKTRAPVETGSQVILSNPLLGESREYVILMHDGARLVDRDCNPILDPEPIFIPREEFEDFEDQGSRAFNYRSERIIHRLARSPDLFEVFNSVVHGDPATPLFLAYQGDPAVIRFVFPADRARAHTFHIHAHKWLRSPDDLNSEVVPARGQATVGTADDFYLFHGAGGWFGIPGDYLYRSGNLRWDVELGMWGIIRVLAGPSPDLAALENPGPPEPAGEWGEA